VNRGDTFLPLISNFVLEYDRMQFKTTRRGGILMANTIKRRGYFYTVCN
jgi:hypothetical protein